MGEKNLSDLDLPTIISVVALLFSIGTFFLNAWYRTFRGPKLRVILGDTIRLYYNHRFNLRFNTSLTVLNNGAQYAAIVKISGEIADLERDHKAEFSWRVFVEHKDIGTPGESSRPWTAITGAVRTLLVPGLGAIETAVGFGTYTPFVILPGTYRLEFRVYGGHQLRPFTRLKQTITVSEEVAKKLEAECIGSREGVTKDSVVLRRNIGHPVRNEKIRAIIRRIAKKKSVSNNPLHGR